MGALVNRIRRAKKVWLKRDGALVERDELTALADRFGSDKGTLLDGHCYTRVYKKLFEDLRVKPITFLEMGLLRTDDDGRRIQNGAEGSSTLTAGKAPSLEMWREFFPFAEIFGFDIDDFSSIKNSRYKIVQGDMSSPLDLQILLEAIGGPIDVIIDDASHASHHQQVALGYLFPHLRPGGMYIIEDLCWQDEELEKEGIPKTRDVLRKLQIDRSVDSPVISEEQKTFIARELEALWLFDSLTEKLADATDSLAVLVRKGGRKAT